MADYSWMWFIIAGILIIFEMLSFSSYALWIAIGAGFTGILAYLIPNLGSMYELLIFAFFQLLV